MVQVEINKDVRKFKDKFVGPLSLRETICLTIGVGLAIFVKNVFFPDVDMMSDFTIIIILFCVGPFAALGWVKVYGLNVETFIKTCLPAIMAQKKRIYDNVLKEPKIPRKVKASRKKSLQMIK